MARSPSRPAEAARHVPPIDGGSRAVTAVLPPMPGQADGLLHLDQNESPLGPSPAALEALTRGQGQVRLYPDPAYAELERVIAMHHAIEPESVVAGAGSTGVLGAIIAAQLPERPDVVFARPTYAIFEKIVLASDGRLVGISDPLAWRDPIAMFRRIGGATGVVYLPSPHNPIGELMHRPDWLPALERYRESREDPEGLARLEAFFWDSKMALEMATHFGPPPRPGFRATQVSQPWFVVDEAYVDYAIPLSLVRHSLALVAATQMPDTIVLRTFSKAYGLAGLRVGYAVTHPDTARRIRQRRLPGVISTLAPAAVLAALEDRAHLERVVEQNQRARALLVQGLQKLGLTVASGDANFCRVTVGQDAFRVRDRLAAEGILVCAPADLPDQLRITTGLDDDMTRVISALARVLKGASPGR